MDDFEERINYAWPVTATIAGMYQYFFSKIKKQKKYFKDKRLVIFGAGIRGCTLLLMLEEQGFKDIVFCDNNPEKQNGRINQYPILSFQGSHDYKGNQIFLLPIENGETIRQQVLVAGLEENKDFFYWDYQIYDEYMQEFERPVQGHVLVMGDCAFNHISIQDENKDSFGDMVKKRLGEDNCTVLAMHGMGQRAYYNIQKSLVVNRNERPSFLLLLLVMEVLTSKAHLMPRTQHPVLIKKILDKTPNPDDELIEYAQLAQKRFESLQIETFASYRQNNFDVNAKLFMRMNYMFKIKEMTEGVVYLKETLRLMNKKHIPVVLWVPPVNYMFGEQLWGKEFTREYNRNFETLWGWLKEFKYEVMDTSFLLNDSEFASTGTIDETTNYNGRLKQMDFFEKAGIFNR